MAHIGPALDQSVVCFDVWCESEHLLTLCHILGSVSLDAISFEIHAADIDDEDRQSWPASWTCH